MNKRVVLWYLFSVLASGALGFVLGACVITPHSSSNADQVSAPRIEPPPKNETKYAGEPVSDRDRQGDMQYGDPSTERPVWPSELDVLTISVDTFLSFEKRTDGSAII
jgi:hypothetical protein